MNTTKAIAAEPVPTIATDEDCMPEIAPEFVSILADTSYQTLVQWLERHAPPTVKELFDLVLALNHYMDHALLTDRVPYLMNRSIAEDVLSAVNLIPQLGGVFHGEGAVSTVRAASDHRPKAVRRTM